MRLDANKINQFLADMYSIVVDTNSELEDIDYFYDMLSLYNRALHLGFPLHEYEPLYLGRNVLFPAYGDIPLPETMTKFGSGIILQPLVDSSVFMTTSGKRMVEVMGVGGLEFTLGSVDVYNKLKNVIANYGLFMTSTSTSPVTLNVKFPIPSDIMEWNLVEVLQAPSTLMQVNSVTAGSTILNPHPRYGYMYQMGNNELGSVDISISGLEIGPNNYIVGLTYLDIKYREYIPAASSSFAFIANYNADMNTSPILITDEPDGTSVVVRLYYTGGDPSDPTTADWSSEAGGLLPVDIHSGDTVNVEVILTTSNKNYTPIFYGIII